MELEREDETRKKKNLKMEHVRMYVGSFFNCFGQFITVTLTGVKEEFVRIVATRDFLDFSGLELKQFCKDE